MAGMDEVKAPEAPGSGVDRPLRSEADQGKTPLLELLAKRATAHPERVALTMLGADENEVCRLNYRELDGLASDIRA